MRLVKAAKASLHAKFYSLSTGATQPLSKDEEAAELCRNPTVEPHARVFTYHADKIMFQISPLILQHQQLFQTVPHARMQTADPKIGRVYC